MGELEDKVRADIERKYGSIPRMAEQTSVAKNTIYHALERGLDNTTTRTRLSILEPLYGNDYVYAILNADDAERTVDVGERELVGIFRRLNDQQRAAILAVARAMVV